MKIQCTVIGSIKNRRNGMRFLIDVSQQSIEMKQINNISLIQLIERKEKETNGNEFGIR